MPQVDVLILETFNSLQQAVCRSCCSGPLEDKDSTSTEQQLSSNPAPRELIGGRGNSYLYTEGLGIAFIWDLCSLVWIFMEKLIRGIEYWWRSIYWHSDCEKRNNNNGETKHEFDVSNSSVCTASALTQR